MAKAWRNALIFGCGVGVVIVLGVLGSRALAEPIPAWAPDAEATTPRQDKDVCSHFASRFDGQGLKPGSWGNVPKPLQQLPPGAKLCGATMMSTVVASPLTGKELEAYVTPLFEKAGCTQMACTISSRQTDCICHHPDRWGHPAVGRVLTDPGLALLQIYY